MERLRAERNAGSKQIGQWMREGRREEAALQSAHMSDIGEQIKQLEEELISCEAAFNDAMLRIPNLPHPSVPIGKDESENVVVREVKQSVLLTWLPRALAAGAEIRDLAMVGRVEHDDRGRATGVNYFREGRWRFQKAKNVVVAGYAIETPRLLLNSASAKFPDGLANSSGLVGKNLTVQANQAVWGLMEKEIRSYKGPPSLAITEHWNYADEGKDFFGGYAIMSQGPLPTVWAGLQSSKRGLWGQKLIDEMKNYNHQVGLKIVGEFMPQERNCVTLAEEHDRFGLPIARVTYSWCDNDKRLIRHSLGFMRLALEAAGARDIFDETNDTCHLNGTARMGFDRETSVVDADCRSWDVPNLWICDGSVFPTVGGVNPSLTIQAIACRTADRIREMARRGEL